jgi:CubicO group peptidase (beta-lactamase class C family)
MNRLKQFITEIHRRSLWLEPDQTRTEKNARPMNSGPRTWCIPVFVLSATLVSSNGGCAPQAEIPRDQILPAMADSTFSYATSEEVGISSATLEDLVRLVGDWVSDGEIIGAEFMIVKDRKIALHEAIGWNDIERGFPMRRNSIFRMRSMTKPFTGTSVLILQEEGKLNLDNRVSSYLPSFDNDLSREITLRQLLTHTGGYVQNGFPAPFYSYGSLREVVDAVGAAGPQHAPGEYRYSDVGSAILGAVVEQVSDMPVERFIEARILEPLGMADTHTRFSINAPWAERMNSTYRRSDGSDWTKYWDNTREQRFPFFRASGGLYSTTMDYARFLAAFMDGGMAGGTRILSEASVGEALSPSPHNPEYGLHWMVSRISDLDDVKVFGHGGSDGTIAYAIPELDFMVLYFTQSRGTRTRQAFVREALKVLSQ